MPQLEKLNDIFLLQLAKMLQVAEHKSTASHLAAALLWSISERDALKLEECGIIHQAPTWNTIS